MYYLYLKIHNVTKLHYLGYTKKNPFKYTGSGSRWLKHIKKHGNFIKTEILHESNNIEEIKEFGLAYSLLWNIVESPYFANLIIEDCSGRGCFGSLNGMYGKTHTDEVKHILSENAKKSTGKTYEQRYGIENAIKLKELRSKTFSKINHKGKHNSRFDHTIYSFYNLKTKEIFKGTRFDFYTKYNLPKSSIHNVIKRNIICRNWKLVAYAPDGT